MGDLVGGSSSLAFIANMTSLSTLYGGLCTHLSLLVSYALTNIENLINLLVYFRTLRNCRISDNLASVDFSKFVELGYL